MMERGNILIKRNKITISYIKEYLQRIGSSSILLSEKYVNNSEKLEFLCSCGVKFERNFSNIQQRKSCQCVSCGHKKGWREKRRFISYKSDIVDRFYKSGYKVIDTDYIERSKDKILVEDFFGYRGYLRIRDAELNKHFSTFSVIFNESNLVYNLNNFCYKNNFNTKILDYWKDGKTIRLKCKCSCGNDYYTNVADFVDQRRIFCKECTKSQSRYERFVKEEFKANKISFIEQKRFSDCRSDKTNFPLPFDFYLPDYNICIEVDGEQHFAPIRFKTESEEKALEFYERTSYNDKIKDKYCQENNILLLRISYLDIKSYKYKQIIQSIMN